VAQTDKLNLIVRWEQDRPDYQLIVNGVNEGWYAPTGFNIAHARELAENIFNILTRYTQAQKDDWSIKTQLEGKGQLLYTEFFPNEAEALPSTHRKPVARLKEQLRPEHSDLVLSLVEDLLWVPWELLHDGEKFFCERFRISRLVDRTEVQRGALAGRNDEKRKGPGAIVALGSVKDLKFKDEKENVLARLKDMYDGYAQSLPDKSVDEMLLLLDKGFEVFHFVGHGKHDELNPAESGWQCARGGVLSAARVTKVEAKRFPRLIFANACDSARPTLDGAEGDIGALYLAFLKNRVPHYIGTVARINDTLSGEFGTYFYEGLRNQESVGEALHKARLRFMDHAGPPIWAYYVHYGDPSEPLVPKGSIYEPSGPPPKPERTLLEHLRQLPLLLIVFVVAVLGTLLAVAWHYDLADYLYRFSDDTFGIVLAEFAVRDEAAGTVNAVRYLDAEVLQGRLDRQPFPQQRLLRNVSRTFSSKYEAQRYAARTRSRLVVWGYGTKTRQILELHAAISLSQPTASSAEQDTAFDDLTLGRYPVEFRLRSTRDSLFRIPLAANSNDPESEFGFTARDTIDTVARATLSSIVVYSSANYLYSNQNNGRRQRAEAALLACIQSPEIERAAADDCRLALGLHYLLQGKTRSGEALVSTFYKNNRDFMVSDLAPHDRPNVDLSPYYRWIDYLRQANIAYLTSVGLGLPADLLMATRLLDAAELPTQSLQSSVAGMHLCLLNMELVCAERLARQSLREAAANKGVLDGRYVDNVEYHVLSSLARIGVVTGEYESSRERLSELDRRWSSRSRRSDVEFWTYLNQYRESGDRSLADKALHAASGDAFNRGTVLEAQGQLDAVLNELRKGVEQGRVAYRPLLAAKLIDRGLRMGETANFEEAIAVCKEGQGLDSTAQRRCSLAAADAAYFAGRRDESGKTYAHVWPISNPDLSALSADKIDAVTGYIVARRFREFGRASDLFASLYSKPEGREQDFVDLQSAIGAGYAVIRAGKPADGQDILSKAFARSETFASVFSGPLLAWAYCQSGKVKEAERVLAEDKIPRGPGIERARGLLYHQQGQIQTAIAKFTEALNLGDSGLAHLYLAIIYMESGDPQNALSHLHTLTDRTVLPADRQSCDKTFSYSYATIGQVWDPRVCRDPYLLARRVSELEARLAKAGKSVELRDHLYLLYRIGCAVGEKATLCDPDREITLLREAIKYDARDSFNVPGPLRGPASRYIELATLLLEQKKAGEALQTLRECITWYSGDPKASLWSLEGTGLLDVLFGNGPAAQALPPFYTPSLVWPRIEE
jgi:tetratricopeptide (TPR) repeat protein